MTIQNNLFLTFTSIKKWLVNHKEKIFLAIFSVIYYLSPADLIPEIFPYHIGKIDDLILIFFSIKYIISNS